MTALDLDRLADVLRSTADMPALDVALELADIGIPELPTVPGGKAPMLTREHIDAADRNGEKIGTPCAACRAAGLKPAADHGATTDPDLIRRYWTVHPDAGVGMKNHPQIVRGDADHDTAAELKKARKSIGYGQPGGCAEPFEARTPGGQYRRRYLHALPEGVPAPGGGTKVLGVSWYGTSGYVVVKGGHPSGKDYAPFSGDGITPLPETVVLALERKGSTGSGSTVQAANAEAVDKFLATYTGTKNLERLAWRRKFVATARPGDRHHQALGQLVAGFREAIAGYHPARTLADAVHDALGEAGWTTDRLEGDEWAELLAWAVGKVAGLDPNTAHAAIVADDYKRQAEHLEDRYPADYLEATADHESRDLTEAELDEWLAGDPNGAPDDGGDGDRREVFHDLPDVYRPQPLEWLVRGLLPRETHGQIGGGQKTLKSYIGCTIGVGVALGRPVLGRFEVPERRRVLLIAGEGGERLLLARLYRICRAYGADWSALVGWLRFSTVSAPITSPVFAERIAEEVEAFDPGYVNLDPWYVYGGGDVNSSQLNEVGERLESVRRVVGGGRALLINHHLNQTGTGTGIVRLAGAGHAEWVDSWLLLAHRTPPNVDAGQFRLALEVGSRQWGGSSWNVDYDVGHFDAEHGTHDGDIAWTVTPKGDGDTTTGDGFDSKVAAAEERVVKTWKQRRDQLKSPWTITEWLDRTTGTKQLNRTAFYRLVDGCRIVCATGDPDARGAKWSLNEGQGGL